MDFGFWILRVEMTNTEHQALLCTLAMGNVLPGSQKDPGDSFCRSFPYQKFLIADNFQGNRDFKERFPPGNWIGSQRGASKGQQKKGREGKGGMVKSGFY